MTILFIIKQAPYFKWTKLYTYSKNNSMHINFEKFGVSKICFFLKTSLYGHRACIYLIKNTVKYSNSVK